jgi:hypothetical protein
MGISQLQESEEEEAKDGDEEDVAMMADDDAAAAVVAGAVQVVATSATQGLQWLHAADTTENASTFAQMWMVGMDRIRNARPNKTFVDLNERQESAWVGDRYTATGCGRGIIKSILFQWCVAARGFLAGLRAVPATPTELSFAHIDLAKLQPHNLRVFVRDGVDVRQRLNFHSPEAWQLLIVKKHARLPVSYQAGENPWPSIALLPKFAPAAAAAAAVAAGAAPSSTNTTPARPLRAKRLRAPLRPQSDAEDEEEEEDEEEGDESQDAEDAEGVKAGEQHAAEGSAAAPREAASAGGRRRSNNEDDAEPAKKKKKNAEGAPAAEPARSLVRMCSCGADLSPRNKYFCYARCTTCYTHESVVAKRQGRLFSLPVVNDVARKAPRARQSTATPMEISAEGSAPTSAPAAAPTNPEPVPMQSPPSNVQPASTKQSLSVVPHVLTAPSTAAPSFYMFTNAAGHSFKMPQSLSLEDDAARLRAIFPIFSGWSTASIQSQTAPV